MSSPEDNVRSIEDNTGSLENVRERLEEIATPARTKGRVPPKTRDEIVIALCRIAPLSIAEISALMARADRRSAKWFSTSDLSRIQYLYPDKPSHPQQKYTANPH